MKKAAIYIISILVVLILIFGIAGGYKYSGEQKEVIGSLGAPDAFEIYMFSDEKAKMQRVEKWYYYDSLQAYIFNEGTFLGIEEIADPPDEFVKVPYEPSDFQKYMRIKDMKLLAGDNACIEGSEEIPEIFQDVGVELFYSKQFAAGFDRSSGDLIYVRSFILVPDNETIEQGGER